MLGTTAVLTLSTAAVRLLAIFTAPILTAALGPAPYGVIALAGTATSLASTITMLGIGAGYTRSVLGDLVSDRAAAERFCWRFVAVTTALGTALAALAGPLDLSARLGLDASLPAMLAIGLAVGNAALLVTIRCRIRGAYATISVAAIANGLSASALSIALALGWRADAWALFLGATAGSLVAIAVSGGFPLRALVRPSGLTRAERRRILAFGAPTAVTTLMFWIVSSSDRWFLGLLAGEHELGVYSFAYNVGGLAMLLNVAVSQAWLPEVLRSYDEDPSGARAAVSAAWSRTFGGLAIAWLAVAAAGGDVIRLLAAEEFHEGARFVPWIAGGVFFYGFAQMAVTGLMVRNEMRPAAAWWLGGALGVLALNYVLVQRLGGLGAAFTSTVGFGAISAGVLWSAQKRLHLPLPWWRMGAASALLVASGAACAPAWSVSPLTSLAWKLAPCAIAALAATEIIWPSWRPAAAAWLRHLRESRRPER